MVLDATTIKNLELIRNLRDGRQKGSLLDYIDFTITSMGGRLLRNWLLQPLLDCSQIEDRLDAVEEFLGKFQVQRIRDLKVSSQEGAEAFLQMLEGKYGSPAPAVERDPFA